ncbi:terminase large subunit [Escherichia phage PhaxI]|uniref:Terminase DNA packaging enzyme large subunit n=1 Tax=Escherichia phage PhaxI TaxID=926589 RepID=G9IIL0_9CAUD|nr:terminase large subunit [Escherichia phage PhaxI]AEW24347.1 terminase DNA packaging enzyme large subunit [Escherichia phage PhaxI]
MAYQKRDIEYAPIKTGFKIDDVKLRMDQTFMRKLSVRAPRVELMLTDEQEDEFVECSMDAHYFAANYYKITTIDKGFILFDMHDYQKQLFHDFQDYRFNAVVQARQSGKCVKGDTLVTVYDTLSQEELLLTIGELHSRFEDVNHAVPLNTIGNHDKFVDSRFGKRYFVQSDSGWVPVIAAHKTKKYAEFVIVTVTGRRINVADEHMFFTPDMKEIFAKDLNAGSYIMTTEGPEEIREIWQTGEYHHMYDLQVKSSDQRYYTNGFLSHNTTVVAAFLLWYAMFHSDKEIAVLANKEKQAIEILDRIRKAYQDLPFFLQQGCEKFGSTLIEFENGSKIYAYATSLRNSIRGRRSLLYVDEVAFIENDFEFWESTFPAIASADTSRCILTSTPKGQRGLFYDIVTKADPRHPPYNDFHLTEVPWYKVPAYTKDPDWETKQRARLGDARFDQEFGIKFRGSVGSLIPAKCLDKMTSKLYREPNEFTKIYKEYDPQRLYFGIADTGKGVEGDYSVLTILDITEYPHVIAAKYRNNTIPPMMYAYTIADMCTEYGECPVLVETNNDVGGQVITILYQEIEYPEIIFTSTDNKGTGKRIGGRKPEPGINTNRKVRSIGCANLKALIEKEMLVIEDQDTIDELSTFVFKGARYEADDGCHDDCVMPLVLYSWAVKQEWFSDLTSTSISQDMRNRMSSTESQQVFPFGGLVVGDTPSETEHLPGFGGIQVFNEMSGMTMDEWFKN